MSDDEQDKQSYEQEEGFDQLDIDFAALKAQKEILFAELTTINDDIKSRVRTLSHAQTTLRRITSLETQFRRLQISIIKHNASTQAASQTIATRDFDAFLVLFDNTTEKSLAAIESSSHTASPSTSGRATFNVEHSRPHIKLPTISLPTFDGTIAEFSKFKSLFDCLVHGNTNLSDTEKLQYLITTTSKEANTLVSAYELTADNYKTAYDALVARYANKRRTVAYFIQQILSFKSQHIKDVSKFLELHRNAYNGLKALNITNLGDLILFELMYSNCESKIQETYDRALEPNELPSFSKLLAHIESYARSHELKLDQREIGLKSNPEPTGSAATKKQMSRTYVTQELPIKPPVCAYCKKPAGNHTIYTCYSFRALSPQDKLKFIKSISHCTNCLAMHSSQDCVSTNSCRICGKSHHTYLHFPDGGQSTPKQHEQVFTVSAPAAEAAPPLAAVTDAEEPANLASNCLSCVHTKKPVLLATIHCRILAADNSLHDVRLLLDPAAETNLITYKLAQKLGLPMSADTLVIQGVSKNTSKSLGKVDIVLFSSTNEEVYDCSASILPIICDDLPAADIAVELCEEFQRLDLADREFHCRSPVDILLGVQAYSDLLTAEQPNLIKGTPTAIRTIFGWVLLGSVPTNTTPTSKSNSALTLLTLEESITKFWEVESAFPETCPLSAEDEFCESQFVSTTQRNSEGRFIVRFPFKPGKKEVAGQLENRLSTLRCFNSLDRRLHNDPSALSEFHAFMKDYIDSGHMKIANSTARCMLPYSLVSKESTTTRTRVVFNPSFKCKQMEALNSLIFAGPNLQKEVSTVLTTFRFHPIVLTCDIKAMYRQILIHPDELIYQHIWYKPHGQDNVEEYELQTLTYGFNFSPWAAQRVLKQVAIEGKERFPRASKILLDNSYMDDLNFGSSSVSDAVELRDELIQLLSSGGFPLRKWSSNNQNTINDLPSTDREQPLRFLEAGPVHKVLGLQWDPNKDCFVYSFKPFDAVLTKRAIIGYISCIFDPNGYISPIVFTAKHFMQKLWLLQLGWDDPLPQSEIEEWLRFSSELNQITNLYIPRWLQMNESVLRLVGFCDASMKGYSAVIYLHTASSETFSSVLIKSKTRVAPIKLQTIPRLEIMAATLLTETLKSLEFMRQRLPIASIHLFSDSQIALAWIKKSPLDLTTFVAHRVQAIQNATPACDWNYIPTDLNPADLACRGVPPADLLNNHFWFSGPTFLQTGVESWPTFGTSLPAELPEVKAKVLAIQVEPDWVLSCFDRCSSFLKLQRVAAWINRFIRNVRGRLFTLVHNRVVMDPLAIPPLTSSELEEGRLRCVRVTQQHDFSNELESIQNHQRLPKRVLHLSPFIDPSGILRVGGRIAKSDLPVYTKHPILLSKSSRLSQLISEYYHEVLLHAGPKTTRSFIQRRYWIIGSHNLIKKVVRQCKNCHRLNAKPDTPRMSDLPYSRLHCARPFYQVGLDFGGPFSTKDTGLRKSRLCKTYMMVIVCHATKAVYLDAVSDLSTNAFLAAFNRFTSRRGLPHQVFCDNATNFTGASNAMKSCSKFLKSNHDKIFTSLASLNIQWIFNVPLAPHMAGLQEAAVKSAKQLLRRQLGNHVLTFEEFTTILARAEAVLNSRPIGYLSSDPGDDFDYLSPGHFLIGAPLLAVPEEIIDSTASVRHRWKLTQQLSQHFWNRWKNEYVNTLVQRQKWHKATDNLQVGELVYLADIPSSPLSWPLGRVITVHPGSDGVIRSATVRTSAGLYKRPVVKLVKLPKLH